MIVVIVLCAQQTFLQLNKKFLYLELDEDMMAAQCFVFFFAGFDTSSSTVSFCLYELALQPELQQRVREEIEEVLGDSDMPTYEQLAQVKLLDKCVSGKYIL